MAAVEDVHRIDDHRRIGRALTIGIAVLLYGDDRVLEQAVLPRNEALARPIAVDALVRGNACVRDLVEDYLDVLLRDVVRVDEDGEPGLGAGLSWHTGLSTRNVCPHDTQKCELHCKAAAAGQCARQPPDYTGRITRAKNRALA